MTRRERLERRKARREEWAEKAEGRAAERFDTARRIVAPIPPGQPILVGHHSEKGHRNTLDRHDRAMRRGAEEHRKASRHAEKADGIQRQLDRSIFSDDPDALERLAEKVEAMEKKRETWKAWNRYWRKHGTMKGCPGISDEAAARLDAEIPQRYSWERQPVAKYQLSNLGSEIRRAKKRMEEIRARQERSAKADAAGGVLVEDLPRGYVRVTYPEAPAREIRQALRAAGFQYGAGSWLGERDRLPAIVAA